MIISGIPLNIIFFTVTFLSFNLIPFTKFAKYYKYNLCEANNILFSYVLVTLQKCVNASPGWE